ncbi:methyltransferase domain-containing protein [Isoptericola sp. NEAU-Y5]|uniref:Methyltransferase domain-containing protein n=1 Tax=Isoptericola luteus TaxID=2879484 RepID=A0ABS7ZMD1_9MICO|nr:class I SAM-dependent methyltransferase [Isoptericola sp. NEAU-Y5]MCA5894819.1 methyltransferase domain-containing protein [Isoptericola sp. NEAU-Y5]
MSDQRTDSEGAAEPAGADLNDAIEAPSTHHTVPSKESESYTHGHHESVLRAHRSRTAQNSAGFLLPHLRDDMSLLDVGCGPGTVTADLARILAGGEVVGVDASAKVLDAARQHAEALGNTNVRFEQADVYELPFADDSFDVVYAHQLLQHLSDPVAALREMRRVARPGGLVALRDADYAAMAWYPESPGLQEWNTLYHEVTHAYGFEPDAGRRLMSWAMEAGLDGIVPSASSWCYATPTDRQWWGQVWAERCVESNFAVQAQESGLADDVALEQLAQDWLAWAQAPDGWFAILHGEVLARA